MSGSWLPGPELPQAWVRLAEGRGPGGEDGREGGTPGEWAWAVIRFLTRYPNPISQQGSPVLMQWDRDKRQCGWTSWKIRTLMWHWKRCHPISHVGSLSSWVAFQPRGSH